jgi:hypothetical protein
MKMPFGLTRHDSLMLAAILLAAVVFFAPFLFSGKIFLAADTLYTVFPWRAWAPEGFRAHNPLITDPVNHNYAEIYNRQLKEGSLQDWNPYVLGGIPATGATAMSGMSGRWYPLKLLLHRLLPTPVALTSLLFIHVLLMGVSMYLFLRVIGVGPPAALFGATAYMFNGCAMVWLEFESTVASSTYLPFLLICLERLRSRARWTAAFAGGILMGIICLMGHLQYLVYIGLLMGAYLVFVLYRQWRDRQSREIPATLAAFGVICLLGGLIGGIELLPVIELLGNSGRIGRSFTFETYFSTLGRVPWRWLVTLIFPDWYGSPALQFSIVPSTPGQEYMNYCELALYVGVPTLFLLLAAFAAPGNSHRRFWLGASVLVVLLMTGTPAYYPFFWFVPGMNKMNPTRIVFLFTLAAPIGAAFGFDALERLDRRRKVAVACIAGVLLAVTAVLALAGTTPGLIRWFNLELFAGAGERADRLVAMIAGWRRLGSPIVWQPLAAALLTTGGLAGILFLRRRRIVPLLQGALVVLLAVQLISFGRGYNTVVDRETVYPVTPAIEWLRSRPGIFRVVQGQGFMTNTLGPFGIQDLGGYSSFYPARTNRLASYLEMGPMAFQGAAFDRWVTFDNNASPFLDLANVKYLVTPPGSGPRHPKWREVYRQEMGIWENGAALPRAFGVHRHRVVTGDQAILSLIDSGTFDPAGEVILEAPEDPSFVATVGAPGAPPRVDIAAYEPDRVELAASFAGGGWLVLTDIWYPGWTASVDGVSTEVLRADYNYRAVRVPAGQHRVVFEYRPTGRRRGTILSLAGVLAALTGLGWILFRSRRGCAAQSARGPSDPA